MWQQSDKRPLIHRIQVLPHCGLRHPATRDSIRRVGDIWLAALWRGCCLPRRALCGLCIGVRRNGELTAREERGAFH